jgi:hypothetical protein
LLPQTFGLPAPHTRGAVHVPQESVPPHPSIAAPQSYPRLAQVLSVHAGPPASVTSPPHLSNPPPPQYALPEHGVALQSIALPQPSEALPQSYPRSAHVFGVQLTLPSAVIDGFPHLLNPPTPHISGAEQAPQSTVPPHPSALTPQSNPRAAHVVGVQLLLLPPESAEKPKPLDPSNVDASNAPVGVLVAELPHATAIRKAAPENTAAEMRRPT